MSKITDKMREELRAPIEDKYLKQHPSQSYLTVIHPMAVVERLNNVFGVGAWRTSVRKGRVTGEGGRFTATCMFVLDIPEYGVHLEQYGGSTNGDSGDALKGAATDALTKCASYLEIGFEIYSGAKDRKGGNSGGSRTNNSTKPASDKQRFLVKKLMQEKEVTGKALMKLQSSVEAAEWTSAEASKAIEWLNEQPERSAE